MTAEMRLEGRLAFWQKTLRLQDWDIEVRIVRRQELRAGLARAEIEVYRRARVLILDPTDQDETLWPADKDLEVSLVHELLHLQFHDVGDPKDASPEHVALERAIEATALALVRLDREKGAQT